MSSTELTGWIAFIKRKNRKEQEEIDKEKAKQKKGATQTYRSFNN